jgi:hypothetical protein
LTGAAYMLVQRDGDLTFARPLSAEDAGVIRSRPVRCGGSAYRRDDGGWTVRDDSGMKDIVPIDRYVTARATVDAA